MKKAAIIGMALISVLVLIKTFHFVGEGSAQLKMEMWSKSLASYGWIAIIIGFLAVAIQTVFPFLPFFLLAGANVLVFGLAYGFLINWTGAVFGAVLSFYFSRWIAYDWVKRKVEHTEFMIGLNRQIARRGFLIIFLSRLFAIVPSSVINMTAGISEIRFTTFILATLIGKLPVVLLESMVGYDLINFGENKRRLLILVLIFIAIIAIGTYLRKQWIGKKG